MEKVKILIVDDSQSYLDLLDEYLCEHGYDVICTLNGEEAEKVFEEFKPNLVLTDIVMPVVDGIELLFSLRKIDPDILVIAMSGGNKGHADTYLRMANNLGANAILNKPFELSDLLLEIKQLCPSH